MLHTFQVRRGTGPIDESGYKTLLKQLTSLQEQGYIPEDFGALLRSMLSWDPADRPTAKQALDHRVWRQQGIAGTASNSHKRQCSDMGSECSPGAGGSGSGGGIKRMRRSDGQSPSSPGSGSKGEE